MDTKNLTEVIDLALGAVEAGVAISKDGKVDASDFAALMALIPLVGPAIGDIGQIPAELKDMTEEEAAVLVAHVVGKLGVDSAKAAHIIEASFKLAVSGYGLYKAVKE